MDIGRATMITVGVLFLIASIGPGIAGILGFSPAALAADILVVTGAILTVWGVSRKGKGPQTCMHCGYKTDVAETG